jgi:hypothetical protein
MASLYYISSYSFSGVDPLHKPDKEQTIPRSHTKNQESNKDVTASSKINVSSHFPKMKAQRDITERTIVSSGTGGPQSTSAINTMPKRVMRTVFSQGDISHDIHPLVDIESLDPSLFSSLTRPEDWEDMRLPRDTEIDDLLNSVYNTSVVPSTLKEKTTTDLPRSSSSDQEHSSLVPLEITQSNKLSAIERESPPSPSRTPLSQTNPCDSLAAPAFASSQKEDLASSPSKEQITPIKPTSSSTSSSSKKRKAKGDVQQGPDQQEFVEINIQKECAKGHRLSHEQTETVRQCGVYDDISSKWENSIPKWVLTENGKKIVNYFSEAMESDRWHMYFMKRFRLEEIQIDYMVWCWGKVLVSERDFPKIKALLSLFSVIDDSIRGTPKWHRMNPKEMCLTRIRLLKQIIDDRGEPVK